MTINHVLTCREVVELVTEYLENALLPAMRKQLEEHIADCTGCATYLEQVRQTVRLLQQLAQEPTFPATTQELLELFRNWKQGATTREGDSH